MTAAVDRLIHFGPDTLPQAPEVDLSYGKMVDKMQRRKALFGTELWYLNRLLMTPNPLQEKMAYFWSNHFTSAMGQKGITPAMTIGQLALFRRYALGNYAQLTHDVSRDAAMLHYLDGIQNRSQHPNENYARELMELFTMGVGNYSEDDVRESARAFTGFTVNRRTGEFRFVPQLHDDGSKTFLGHTGNFNGDQVVDIIMQQPATGRFMARKFLRAFVYDDPEPALVDAVAGALRSSGYDVGPLMNTLLRSNVFYSDRAYRAIVKSPLEITIGALKTLGATTVGIRTLAALNTMGQVPLRPPNVAGWPGGALWMNQGVFLARLNYLHQLVMFKSPGTGGDPAEMTAMDMPAMKGAGRAMKGMLGDPAGQLAEPSTWVAGASVNDPRSVAQHVLQTVVQGDATAEQQTNILDFLSTDGVGNHVTLSRENFEEKVRGAMSLAMALPSYQLA